MDIKSIAIPALSRCGHRQVLSQPLDFLHPIHLGLKIPPPKQGTYGALAPELALNLYSSYVSYRFDQLLRKITSINPAADVDLICRAFIFASEKHAGQLRKSGEPYLNHLLGAAEVAVAAGDCDHVMIAAIFLHDVVEDTTCPAAELEKTFGQKIAQLVDGVTKFMSYKQAVSARARGNIAKTLESSMADSRVFKIRFCDRIDNMKTLWGHQNEDKRLAIARETLEIFAPLANQLGCRAYYRDLMDLSLSYLKPVEYEKIKQGLLILGQGLAAEVSLLRSQLLDILIKEEKCEDGIEPPLIHHPDQIIPTPRRPYEIFEQVEAARVRADYEVLPTDLLSFLVLVDRITQTDSVVGRVQRRWRYVGYSVDLLAFPGPNEYRGKHTRVLSESGEVIRVQTTSQTLHERNELGAKDSARARILLEYWLKFLKAADVPFDSIRAALKRSGKQITVHAVMEGKKPSEKRLESGATAWDLAFTVHEEIGRHADYCFINDRKAPLDRILEEGDRVSIVIDPEKVPRPADLAGVNTLGAAASLRSFLRLGGSQVIEQAGKQRLQVALKELYLKPEDLIEERALAFTRLWLTGLSNSIKGIKFEATAKAEEIVMKLSEINDPLGKLFELKEINEEGKKGEEYILRPDETQLKKLGKKTKDKLFDFICRKEYERLLFYIGSGTISATEAANALVKMFNKNKDRMDFANSDLPTDASAEQQKAQARERKKVYRFIISAEIPNRLGMLGKISGAISTLGINIERSNQKGESLELEVKINSAMHEIQIRNIIEGLAEGQNITTSVSREGWWRFWES